MRNKNTRGIFSFIISQIWWTFLTYIWYNNLLFRCLPDLSFKESRALLIFIVGSVLIIGSIIRIKNHRNDFSIFVNITTGFNIYFIITYFTIRRRFFIIVLAIVFVLALTYAVLVFCQRVRNPERIRQILRGRFRKVCVATSRLVCVGISSAMVLSGTKAMLNGGIFAPTVVAARSPEIEDATIANNIKTLALLRDEEWDKLSLIERLDILQIIANIEARVLGLPHELNVVTACLPENTLGHYNDAHRQIAINLDDLISQSSYTMVDVVAHECYHAAQYRMVDEYLEASESARNLCMYRSAAVYKDEFENYVDDDYYEYYGQECEADARLYAAYSVDEYFERIEAYWEEQEDKGDSK